MWCCLSFPSESLPRGVGSRSPVSIQCESLFHKVPGCTRLMLLWRFSEWDSGTKGCSCCLMVLQPSNDFLYMWVINQNYSRRVWIYSGLISFNQDSVLLPSWFPAWYGKSVRLKMFRKFPQFSNKMKKYAILFQQLWIKKNLLFIFFCL